MKSYDLSRTQIRRFDKQIDTFFPYLVARTINGPAERPRERGEARGGKVEARAFFFVAGEISVYPGTALPPYLSSII